ncbi:ATP-binding protein, partial [bacterium]|nr:ATP-binding protein [bacterium]
EVSDKGIGIAVEEQNRIFEKFYRCEDSLVQTTRGTGLGLPLVKHIMEIHNGRIQVSSEPGQGTTLRLLFPVKKQG